MTMQRSDVEHGRVKCTSAIATFSCLVPLVLGGCGRSAEAPADRGALTADDDKPVGPVAVTEGDLRVVLRDNSVSPNVLSGADSLFNHKDAPNFNAFDSAGLNFEHIISGHKNEYNVFSPRIRQDVHG